MIFEIPDVDLEKLTSEELKDHARLCARVAIDVRKQEVACAFETIKREHEEAQTVSYVYSSYSRNPSARRLTSTSKTSTSKRTAAEILQAEEDDNNFGDINDFK